MDIQSRRSELEKELKPTLTNKLKALNIRVPNSFKKNEMVELLLLNEIRGETSSLTEDMVKSAQTPASDLAVGDDSYCLQVVDNNENSNRLLSEKINLMNRILTQNDQILAQNAILLSFLTSSAKEEKQTKNLDPFAPTFVSEHLDSSFHLNQRSSTTSSPLSSTPQRMKNDLSDNISRVNESTTTIIPTENKRKTICILGDSLLRDLDPKIISDKKHLVKIKTHGGEKLSKLNDKVKTKYEHLLKESNTVIFVCGTNSISDHDVNECIREAETLIKTTKSINSNINICMTTVPFRSCKLNQGGFDKIASYNKQLKQICQEQNVELIRINFERELAEELSIPGFLHYRNDFSRKSQGIVTYVRHDINHSLIACSNEAMAMLLEVQVSAYFLLQNAKKDVPLILVGDFNVNTAAPPGGLQQILELFSIRRAFSVSTTHKNTKIDNVFYSNEWEQPSTKVFPELGKSPHFLLEAKFNLQSKSKQK
ncbi:unnamed protein product, partial [Didymodactylos carnosus]